MADLIRPSDSLERDFVLLEHLAFILGVQASIVTIAILTQRPPTKSALGTFLWPYSGVAS